MHACTRPLFCRLEKCCGDPRSHDSLFARRSEGCVFGHHAIDRAVHVDVVEEDQPRLTLRARVEHVRDDPRPLFAPDTDVVAESGEEVHDRPRRDRLADAGRIEEIAAEAFCSFDCCASSGHEAHVLALAAQFGREFTRDDASGAEQNVFRSFYCHRSFARREDYSRKGRLAVIDSACRTLSLRRRRY
jgi:hypothetical protein